MMHMQHYFGGGPGGGAPKPAVAKAVGVTKLMQQCNAMLRERMGEEWCTPQPSLPAR